MREQLLAAKQYQAIEWREDGLFVLDARELPEQFDWLQVLSVQQAVEAIAGGVVIEGSVLGLLAAYALVLEARSHAGLIDWNLLQGCVAQFDALGLDHAAFDWALARMEEAFFRAQDSAEPLLVLESTASALQDSDREANLVLAQYGLETIRRHRSGAEVIVTHGYGGAMASAGVGTSLAVVRAAEVHGLVEHVFACEARPRPEIGRLAAWELADFGVPVSSVTDTAVAHLMKVAGVTWVVVPARRIAANGDVIADIGTYQLAINAMHHGVRFMVVASTACIDLSLDNADGYGLQAEDDEGESIEGLLALGFDVTPVDLIDYIVTERGVIERPDTDKIAHVLCRKRLH